MHFIVHSEECFDVGDSSVKVLIPQITLKRKGERVGCCFGWGHRVNPFF